MAECVWHVANIEISDLEATLNGLEHERGEPLHGITITPLIGDRVLLTWRGKVPAPKAEAEAPAPAATCSCD